MKTENVEFQILDIFSEIELEYNVTAEIKQLATSEYLVSLTSVGDLLPISILSEIIKYIKKCEIMTDYKCHKFSFRSLDRSLKGTLDWTRFNHVKKLETWDVFLYSIECIFVPIK
jgi:hypothetical protein